MEKPKIRLLIYYTQDKVKKDITLTLGEHLETRDKNVPIDVSKQCELVYGKHWREIAYGNFIK